MILVFTMSNNSSCRKTISFFKENNIEFEERKMKDSPFSFEEFLTILSKTRNGVEDIVVQKSEEWKELDIEKINLRDLYHIIIQKPKLLKRPILFTGKKVYTGYRESMLQKLVLEEKDIEFTEEEVKNGKYS